jgi:hypothetical protein
VKIGEAVYVMLGFENSITKPKEAPKPRKNRKKRKQKKRKVK